MCGIVGAIDLAGSRLLAEPVLHAMTDAILHRGPDEDGYFQEAGVSMANRRLSIVGLFDGRQPISNEDGSVWVVFNGEFFDYPERRHQLEQKGHRFRTHCDTEIIPHLWEEYGDGLFEHLRGQYAFALWDRRQRRVILGRDRFGICPLYWTRQGDWLLFGSEIKGILASEMVQPRADLRGINHAFTFFAMPGPVTCFEGISLLLPGHFLDIRATGEPGASATGGYRTVQDRIHWQIDFPDQGQEERGDPTKFVDQLEQTMLASVERRLRADVPVVSYLSGGVDSSLVVALACKIRGNPIPSFTIRIDDPELDETSEAGIVSRHLGCRPTVVNFGADEVLKTYPRLVQSAESPVIDTSCAALLLLAQEVHSQGYKVALSGDGADEWLAGYPWYKVHKLLSWLDFIPGIPLSDRVRRLFLRWGGSPMFSPEVVERSRQAIGGPSPWLDIYGLVSLSKLRFFSPELLEVMSQHIPYSDLGLNLDRARRWHPLNRALYVGARIHLPGLQLHAKGDRIGMHNSVEIRYPFLDEEVFSFLARLDPRLKMRGFGDKHILRLLAERYLPRQIAWRRKAMFRAPFDSFHIDQPPRFVEQLFSRDSLKKTGYFNVDAVQHWRRAFKEMRPGSTQRISVEMGLAGVLSTQLWHHLFIDATLTELPATPPRRQSVGVV
jgi:asparagine synthase (glutamine-hydrolysing)